MIVGGHSRRMIPVLPESTVSAFTAIEFLTRFSGDQLNRFGNRFIPVSGIIDKKVNMI
jgi:malate/lactate dehydrogenase